jgi:hypothetical protein
MVEWIVVYNLIGEDRNRDYLCRADSIDDAKDHMWMSVVAAEGRDLNEIVGVYEVCSR